MHKLLSVIALLAGASAHAASVIPHDLLVHADGRYFWIAQVHQTPNVPSSLQTTIYVRQEGERSFVVLSRIPARVVSMASRGSQLSALLDDGTWLLLSPGNEPITAGGLPAPARLLAISGGRELWRGVGVAPGGIAALTTQPASSTQSATRPGDSPRSASVHNRLVLFEFSANQWKPLAQLPDDVPSAPNVSISSIGDVPYVADLDAHERLHVRHWDARQWIDDYEARQSAAAAAFDLLSDPSLPRLWVQPMSGAEQVYVFGPNAKAPLQLSLGFESAAADRALTMFAGAFRIVALVKGKFIEQDFKLDTGLPDGKPAELEMPRESPLEYFQDFQILVVLVALVAAFYGSFRQRGAIRQVTSKIRDLSLAPLGRRLAAGLIDLAPILLAVAAVWIQWSPGSRTEQSEALWILLVYWAASLFYVIFTTLIESLAGRSLGKVFMGLRVVGLDGKPARPAALVTRNVLRLIDVGLFFFPLLLLLLFPLRQRAGDVAAGTLVVIDSDKTRSDESQPGSNSEQEG